MQRVLVIGSGGAGKSTLALRVGARLGLPVVHLDMLYWKAGWEPTPGAEWTQRVAELVAREAWVIDGNYSGTLAMRLAACDTVIFLDMPRRLCLWRVLQRWVCYRGRSRPTMGAGCPEHLTWAFLTWVWTYSRMKRPHMLRQLVAVASEKDIVVLRSRAEVEQFVVHLASWQEWRHS